ncbi:MAG TPA: VacJ family lipoprotein [Candidatus Hydrogenedentes bacterium]|nr:VacJ family lipoprotein [Candidatus Hydrogenedentota bacterium]
MSKPISFLLALCLCAGCATTSKSTQTNTPKKGEPILTMPVSETPAKEMEVPAKEAEAPASEKAASEDALLEGLESEYASDKEGKDVKNMKDPLKPWNLVWFHFNDKLHFWLIRPVAIGYGKVVPKPVRTGIDSFFSNLKFPDRLISCLLQGRWKDMGIVSARFGINTTAGGLGFYDLAEKKCGMKERDEDFDQAFGRWGIGQGYYLVWPLFGPSSIRGTVGLVGDIAANPLTWIPWPRAASVGVSALNTVNNTSLDPNKIKDLKSATVQPYVALRQAYYENRKKLVEE